MGKEAYLSRPLSDGGVQCQVCEHFCAIRPGETGKCGVRRNVEGTLHLTVYGRPVALNLDPIEKKPLFHFLPGGQILSIGTYGCNFRCPFCQNWSMSQTRDFDERATFRGRNASPEMLVETCRQYGATMIAYTYNEPTVFFEYTLDTAKLAHEQGIRNVYVSNGFMSQASLEMVEPYLDGINVDLKAFTDEFYREQCEGRIEPVKRNIRTIAQETDIWIEVTTLLIPTLNDSDKELQALTEWLVEVDPEIPWHVTAFHPDYQRRDLPATSQAALARAYEIGRRAGLHHVYVGNILDADRESTYCPKCGELLIKRRWYTVDERWQDRGMCPACSSAVAGLWS